MTTQRLTITATVDATDLAEFLADDPDLRGSFRARLNEVFGIDGVVLSSVDVDAVFVGLDDECDACEHERVACLDCASNMA